MAAEDESKKRKKDEKFKKNKKKLFIYGNYNKYYGYRIDRNQEEDPRLTVFKKEWFEGKDCLDVGCNAGLLTTSIAKKFRCRSILGVDIDAGVKREEYRYVTLQGLIASAVGNLRKLAGKEYNQKKHEKTSKSQVSLSADCLDLGISQVSNEESSNSIGEASTSGEENLLDRVLFKKENFIENLNDCSGKYDTVLCLSVTKWVHLNWGDDGLIKLFVKIWKLLRPGGIFVLEPQPWLSYKKNRLVSEAATMNFNSILIRPDLFREILLDKIGFRSGETVTDSLSGTVAGFNRVIMIFVK